MGTLEKVISILKENTSVETDIGPDTELRDELGIESFDTLMILNAIEDEFSIEIDEQNFNSLTSVKDIVDLLNEKYLK